LKVQNDVLKLHHDLLMVEIDESKLQSTFRSFKTPIATFITIN